MIDFRLMSYVLKGRGVAVLWRVKQPELCQAVTVTQATRALGDAVMLKLGWPSYRPVCQRALLYRQAGYPSNVCEDSSINDFLKACGVLTLTGNKNAANPLAASKLGEPGRRSGPPPRRIWQKSPSAEK